jgi:hypothetical protein
MSKNEEEDEDGEEEEEEEDTGKSYGDYQPKGYWSLNGEWKEQGKK